MTASVFESCSQMVLQNVDKAEIKLRMKRDNVAGIEVYYHACSR